MKGIPRESVLTLDMCQALNTLVLFVTTFNLPPVAPCSAASLLQAPRSMPSAVPSLRQILKSMRPRHARLQLLCPRRRELHAHTHTRARVHTNRGDVMIPQRLCGMPLPVPLRFAAVILERETRSNARGRSSHRMRIELHT